MAVIGTLRPEKKKELIKLTNYNKLIRVTNLRRPMILFNRAIGLPTATSWYFKYVYIMRSLVRHQVRREIPYLRAPMYFPLYITFSDFST